MENIIKDILEFISANDVKFIRLAFCDPFGVLKNLSIMPTELENAFYHGVSFDGSAIKGFEDISTSDLFLFPDPTTLSALPWRPEPGCVIKFNCDIKRPDGSIYTSDSRNILKQAIKKLNKLGYSAKIGAECEFYLFKLDEYGKPTYTPIDNGGYLDVAPIDMGEDVRREICLLLSEMGLSPESSHHEQGAGQNEIDFKYSDPLSCADNLLTVKNLVKIVASRHGLFASFMPKPLQDDSGSGLHINISLTKHGNNIFSSQFLQQDIRDNFIAGILCKMSEMTLFLNPTINSYDRLGAFEAPKYISWSHQNRSALIRIPAENDERTRIELRSPDSSLNPYLAFALLLNAGMYGIEHKLQIDPESNINLYTASDEQLRALELLPQTIEEAINIAKSSEFVKNVLGEEFVSKYIALKEQEANMSTDKTKFYTNEYFYNI
ncbi:MAG: type I glutamate--ammonia ligase [Epulopiscium sp. Nele67-Bin001]|nr:MAG: type I glutamate--ammonia ligase [Epulopiscium sp. Nuni2H_MBin001]OON94016.1 MAG: type I glutamate--ammonia ligase [Epulopiscium sp. Nele67-Bin001]